MVDGRKPGVSTFCKPFFCRITNRYAIFYYIIPVVFIGEPILRSTASVCVASEIRLFGYQTLLFEFALQVYLLFSLLYIAVLATFSFGW